MVTSYIVVVSLRNWPVPHQENGSLFSNTAVVTDKQSEREKVLLLVANHFGIEAAELVAAGQIEETLNMALWGLSAKGGGHPWSLDFLCDYKNIRY